MEEFKAAIQNKNPEECKFIDRFNDKLGWSYFDLDEADGILHESPIAVPFEKDFANLN